MAERLKSPFFVCSRWPDAGLAVVIHEIYELLLFHSVFFFKYRFYVYFSTSVEVSKVLVLVLLLS